MINLKHVFTSVKSYQLAGNLSKRYDVGPELLVSRQEVSTDVDDHLWVVLDIFAVEETFENDKAFFVVFVTR